MTIEKLAQSENGLERFVQPIYICVMDGFLVFYLLPSVRIYKEFLVLSYRSAILTKRIAIIMWKGTNIQWYPRNL